MRLPVVSCLCIALSCSLVSAQTTGRRSHPQQINSGITWAQQAILALTGGNPVSSVTESGSVTRTVGGDHQQGSITLQSGGIMTNQIGISMGAGNVSEMRLWDGSAPSGVWTGFDGQQHPMAQQNCWTDAVWFFPALSLLSDYADPNLVFVDLGQHQYSGGLAEHIQVYRYLAGFPPDVQQQIQQLSTVDYYLDSQTALPVAILFSSHGDQDVNASIPMGVFFSQYQSVSGIQIPFQVTRLLNGVPSLQISITSAVPGGQGLSPQHK